MSRATDLRQRFRHLHTSPPDAPTPGILVMPNPWDIGSARVLEASGFLALATTSSGHAASLGRTDQHVRRDELVEHAAALAQAVEIPLNVDAEDGLAEDPDGVRETYRLLASTDAAGASIEDFDPRARSIFPLEVAVERVAAARAGCGEMVLTARCENHLYGVGDLDDTIRRLVAYRDAGADVVYAPGVRAPEGIGRIVADVGIPVNVLEQPGVPSVPELAELGVARVSTGGAMAWVAYGATAAAARELLDSGTSDYLSHMLSDELKTEALGVRR